MSENGERMDSEQDKPANQQHASAPGAALAAAREAMGLSVEQLAEQLKLAPRQVQAIERGDVDALPNRAVARGFIRAYAKAVKLDPAPLVAMVEVEGAVGHADATVRPTKVTASFQESRFPSLTERNNGKPFGAIVAGVAVLALVGGAAAWQFGLLPALNLPSRVGAGTPASAPEPAVTPVVVAPPSSQPVEAPLQSPNVPLISVPPQPGSNAQVNVPGAGVQGEPAGGAAASGAAPAAGTAPATAPGTIAAPVVAAPPAAAQGAAAGAPAAVVAPVNRAAPTVGGAPSVAAVPANNANTAPASPGLIPLKPASSAAPGAPVVKPGVAATAPAAAPAAIAGQAPAVGTAGGKLVLNVKEDSWVEIRRAGQPKLISRMVRAGGTETFNVRADDVLIVGKPSAVSASLAGGKLELTQGPGKSYALVNIK